MLHPKDLTSCQSPCLMHSHGQGVFNVPHALSCIRSLQCHSSILMHKESSMTLKHSHSQGVFNIPHALSWQRSLQCPPPPHALSCSRSLQCPSCALMHKESSKFPPHALSCQRSLQCPSYTLMPKESSVSLIHLHVHRPWPSLQEPHHLSLFFLNQKMAKVFQFLDTDVVNEPVFSNGQLVNQVSTSGHNN